MKDNKNSSPSSGITLLSLIITIIILLILAGITLGMLNANGVLGRASEAAYKTRMAKYKEEVDIYVSTNIIEIQGNNKDMINSGEPLKEVIRQYAKQGEEFDITEEDVNIPIKEIIEDIEKRDQKTIVVYHGEAYYVKSDKNKNAQKEAQWCLDVGIKILELKRPSGMDNTEGKYEFINGVYMNTPTVSGFNKNVTRYVNETNKGTLTPGKWIVDKPEKDWYDYKNRKWANVVVENEGAETYFTWIPRYCFKLDPNTQRSDVKLISVENYWKDPYAEDEENNVTPWEELEAQGYQIPDAFTFEGKALPGFWAMKYNIGETPQEGSIINYDMITKAGTITLKNTKITNPPNQVTKCIIYLNGVEKYTLTNRSDIEAINHKEFKLSGIRQGDNVINITALDANEQMVGSRTRIYSITEVNEPDLSGFEAIKDTTFYVTYDENGNEHSTIPLSNEKPEYWYNYGDAEWANVVVRNNGGEIYYTWIPRYEFVLDTTNQKSVVKFIKGTRNTPSSGCQIPDAFTFDGKNLTGFWAMKYNIGEVDTTQFDTSLITSGTAITTQGVKGTQIKEGQTYTYYINGKKDGNTTENPNEAHEYKNLNPNSNYTLLIEIREKQSNKLVGTIVKQAETSQPNKPELKGFNTNCTYYVTYDNEGNETIGEKIKQDGSNMPKNWYDYGKSRWANIVVKGITKEGKETATYFTWIPRYQFKLDKQTQRSDVKFIEGTGSATRGDYQVPDAFTFDGKALTGYWVMKYNIGDQ